MRMLPGAFVVVQQCRFERLGPVRMRYAPLSVHGIELDGIVLAVHFHMLPAVDTEKPLTVDSKTVLTHCTVLIVLKVFVP